MRGLVGVRWGATAWGVMGRVATGRAVEKGWGGRFTPVCKWPPKRECSGGTTGCFAGENKSHLSVGLCYNHP